MKEKWQIYSQISAYGICIFLQSNFAMKSDLIQSFAEMDLYCSVLQLTPKPQIVSHYPTVLNIKCNFYSPIEHRDGIVVRIGATLGLGIGVDIFRINLWYLSRSYH